MDERREVLVNRMRYVRQEIEQIFNDAEHWNRLHADEQPVDPDPDGCLAMMAEALDASLANEARIEAAKGDA